MASSDAAPASLLPSARDYQQEMLEHSLRQNIIVAMDTGSGKTLIAVLRIRAFLGAFISRTNKTSLSPSFASGRETVL
jgi:ERCC4-related helicase